MMKFVILNKQRYIKCEVKVMKFNFKNRVRNFKLATTDSFVPLFEAITNSIQAIEERGYFNHPCIKIKIERDSYRITDFTSGIFAIEITDNGIGFVKHNYESFITSDSDYKVEIGGKGVGRINWLKAFEMIFVKSVFEENGKKYLRSFQFNIDDEIHNETLEEVSNDVEIATTITLRNLNQEYRPVTEISLKEIANKIIEHFATYFVIGSMPKIEIEDEIDLIDLNEFFEKEKFIQTQSQSITSNNWLFNIRHVFLNASSASKHKIYICAQNRVVCSYDIANIEDLPTIFNLNGQKAIYQCYVSGAFLDKDVNSERTYFSNVIFEDEKELDRPHFELAINLYELVYNEINLFLKDYLQPMINLRDNQVIDYIDSYCPQYKYLTKYASEELKNISYSVASNKDKLSMELSRLNLKFNQKNHDKINKTLQDATPYAKDKLLNLVVPLCENLHSEFANFVLKRAVAGEILERLLTFDLSLKELIDTYFIPYKEATSDISNLWIIDEKLAYPYQRMNGLQEDYFYVYQDDNTQSYIVISFEDPFEIKFNQTNNPVKRLNDNLSKLVMHKTYKLTKYLIVSDAFGILTEGLVDKEMIVLSYQDLIQHLKLRKNSFQ